MSDSDCLLLQSDSAFSDNKFANHIIETKVDDVQAEFNRILTYGITPLIPTKRS